MSVSRVMILVSVIIFTVFILSSCGGGNLINGGYFWLYLGSERMVMEHQGDEGIDDFHWEDGGNLKIQVISYRNPEFVDDYVANGWQHLGKAVDISNSSTQLIYEGYSDEGGGIVIKLPKSNEKNVIYRVMFPGDDDLEPSSIYIPPYGDTTEGASETRRATLIILPKYEWFNEAFKNVTTNFCMPVNSGIVTWKKGLDYPDIYILFAGRYSDRPVDDKVMQAVNEEINKLYPNSRVFIVDDPSSPIANDQDLWEGKIIVNFDHELIERHGVIGGFGYDSYENTNKIKWAILTFDTDYSNYSYYVILEAVNKEFLQSQMVGTFGPEYSEYVSMYYIINGIYEPTKLEKAIMDILKKIRNNPYYGDGTTGYHPYKDPVGDIISHGLKGNRLIFNDGTWLYVLPAYDEGDDI